MKHSSRNKQMFALASPPAERVELAGATYRLVRVFKHDFWAATCLYEREDPGNDLAAETPSPRTGETPMPRDWPPANVVVKFPRRRSFGGIPLDWTSRGFRGNERAVYRMLEGVPGVPRWVGDIGRDGYGIEYIEGRPLDHDPPPPPEFFDRLRTLFDAIHARGVAYADANKRSNILIGPGNQPFLVDYQISVRRVDWLPWPIRSIVAAAVAYVSRSDLYHLYKHKRRMYPDLLTPEEEALSRRRGGVHDWHRSVSKPYRALRRWFLGRQYRKGALQSPTAKLEDHYQPEKETWRGREDRT